MQENNPDAEKTSEQLLEEVKRLQEKLAAAESSTPPVGYDTPDYFSRRVQEEVYRSTRYKYAFSIILFEIDNFELFSNKAGENTVEEMLGMLQMIIRDSTRNTDLVCHFGASKGGIMLPYIDAEGTALTADRMRQAVERVFALQGLSRNMQISASIGIAGYPAHAVTAGQLLSNAAAALTAAKTSGGNRVCDISCISETEQSIKDAEKPVRNREFLQYLDDEVSRCSRYGREFSLILLRVKATGQIASAPTSGLDLRLVAQALKNSIRNVDKSYWFSADEFAILLPNTGIAGAVTVGDKLFQSITSALGKVQGTAAEKIVVKAGVVFFPDDETSREGLISKVEEALKEAEKSDGNRIIAASDIPNNIMSGKDDVNRLVKNLKNSGRYAVFNLLAVVDAREHYIQPHSQNVAKYAMMIGHELKLGSRQMRGLRFASLFHDIGKITVDVSILTKSLPLSEAERQIINKHPEKGAMILEQFPGFSDLAPLVHSHHERVDGTGYPRGLKGPSIPLESRIIAVAEAYDDMTAPRPYRRQKSPSEAMLELKVNAETQFDREVVAAFTRAITGKTRQRG